MQWLSSLAWIESQFKKNFKETKNQNHCYTLCIHGSMYSQQRRPLKVVSLAKEKEPFWFTTVSNKKSSIFYFSTCCDSLGVCMMVLPDVNFGKNKNKDVIYFFPCMASFFNICLWLDLSITNFTNILYLWHCHSEMLSGYALNSTSLLGSRHCEFHWFPKYCIFVN